ncbi:MAG: hypothetical protein WAU76_08205 [Candidatus Sulfotelmatobacter sp.]
MPERYLDGPVPQMSPATAQGSDNHAFRRNRLGGLSLYLTGEPFFILSEGANLGRHADDEAGYADFEEIPLSQVYRRE